jgi:hypothetical protein
MGAVKYVLMIYSNPANWAATGEQALTQDERVRFGAEHRTLQQELRASGELVGGEALTVPANTTTVQVRNGGAVDATDGPYAEVKEHLAGYYVVECETRERAVQIAARMPDARLAAVEVRPVHDRGDSPQ